MARTGRADTVRHLASGEGRFQIRSGTWREERLFRAERWRGSSVRPCSGGTREADMGCVARSVRGECVGATDEKTALSAR
jgi:hypothetical protein